MVNQSDTEDHKLGETNQLLEIESCEENIMLVAQMAGQCQYLLQIISRVLDVEIFGTNQFVDVVKTLALRNNRTQIQIIVFEPEIMIKYRHRLLILSSKLTSIVLRKAHSSSSQYNGSLMIADNVGYIQRDSSKRYEGAANFKDRTLCKYFSKQFLGIWELAESDANLRNMLL